MMVVKARRDDFAAKAVGLGEGAEHAAEVDRRDWLQACSLALERWGHWKFDDRSNAWIFVCEVYV